MIIVFVKLVWQLFACEQANRERWRTKRLGGKESGEEVLRKWACPGGHYLNAPETFGGRKAIFPSSVCKNGEVYTPETSCMRLTSPHIKKMWIKQLCKHNVRDFALALQARKVSGAFEKQVLDLCNLFISASSERSEILLVEKQERRKNCQSIMFRQ